MKVSQMLEKHVVALKFLKRCTNRFWKATFLITIQEKCLVVDPLVWQLNVFINR